MVNKLVLQDITDFSPHWVPHDCEPGHNLVNSHTCPRAMADALILRAFSHELNPHCLHCFCRPYDYTNSNN